jgi:ubiquinone/menaquinone biosynthesis C-methylase UbiE
MNIDQIQDVYDRHAPTYDKSVGLVENLVLGDLRQRFGQQLRGETLEIAIGSGLNLPHYTRQVTRAVGVDLSSGMLDEARKRASRLDREIELIQMNGEMLAFEDNSFDAVGISLSLCTIPRPMLTLEEIARVCRPDGVVIFLEHVRSPHRPVYALQRLWSPVQERSLGCSWVRETVQTVQQAGFQVVSDTSRLLGIFRLVVATPPAG